MALLFCNRINFYFLLQFLFKKISISQIRFMHYIIAIQYNSFYNTLSRKECKDIFSEIYLNRSNYQTLLKYVKKFAP